jgi:thioredoxin-like negative regulator of GroEL
MPAAAKAQLGRAVGGGAAGSACAGPAGAHRGGARGEHAAARAGAGSACAANPADLQARLELAQHFIAHKAWEPALEQLLEIVQRDRAFGDDIGRKTMVQVFDLAASQPQLVSAWRRRLSSALNVR